MFQYLQVENIKNYVIIMSGRVKSIMNLLKTQKSIRDNEISTLINCNKRFFFRFKVNSILIR